MSNINVSDLMTVRLNLKIKPDSCCVLCGCVGEMEGNTVLRRAFPYLIVIWFVVRKLVAVAVDFFLGFSSTVVNGFHLSAKFRVLRVEVLVSSLEK